MRETPPNTARWRRTRSCAPLSTRRRHVSTWPLRTQPINRPSRRADREVEHDMSVVDDLSRLAELRDRGDVSAAEYDQAKQQVLGAPRPATGAPDGG
ncbi:MAG: SHOCT domain-containing protein, partial [Pseudonocardiaceae bacterium]